MERLATGTEGPVLDRAEGLAAAASGTDGVVCGVGPSRQALAPIVVSA